MILKHLFIGPYISLHSCKREVSMATEPDFKPKISEMCHETLLQSEMKAMNVYCLPAVSYLHSQSSVSN